MSGKSMNLLNDLSSELAMAILVEQKHAGKVTRNEGVQLIGKVRDVLETISEDAKEPVFGSGKMTKSTNN